MDQERDDTDEISWSGRFNERFGLSNVKKKRKIQILLAIMISLLLPLLSAYTDYYVLKEADFLSSKPKFENTDLECLVLCEKQRFTVLGSFSYTIFVASDLTGNFSYSYYQVTYPQSKALVLRC